MKVLLIAQDARVIFGGRRYSITGKVSPSLAISLAHSISIMAIGHVDLFRLWFHIKICSNVLVLADRHQCIMSGLDLLFLECSLGLDLNIFLSNFNSHSWHDGLWVVLTHALPVVLIFHQLLFHHRRFITYHAVMAILLCKTILLIIKDFVIVHSDSRYFGITSLVIHGQCAAIMLRLLLLMLIHLTISLWLLVVVVLL